MSSSKALMSSNACSSRLTRIKIGTAGANRSRTGSNFGEIAADAVVATPIPRRTLVELSD